MSGTSCKYGAECGLIAQCDVCGCCCTDHECECEDEEFDDFGDDDETGSDIDAE